MASSVHGSVMIALKEVDPETGHQYRPAVGAVVKAYEGKINHFHARNGVVEANVAGSSTTDRNGNYVVGLCPGTYTVLVEIDGLIHIPPKYKSMVDDHGTEVIAFIELREREVLQYHISL